MKIDLISKIIKDVADQEITPRFRNLKEDEVIFKEPGEFVTTADLAAEFEISEGIRALYPQAVVTGEEDISKNPMKLVELLSSQCGFLIDPIDGTNNFIKGDERFAVMAVALQYGEVVASWIYLPAADLLAVAEKSAGAYLNGTKVNVSPAPEELSNMIGAAHINRMPAEQKLKTRENLKKISKNCPAFCAGYDYVSLTKGKTHFSSYHRTLLWDHLPGTLLYEEAGGYARTLDGELYTARNDGSGLLCAPNKNAWLSIKNSIF